jgi:hypothetical protein
MNRSALLRKAARIFAKSDAPQGALLFQPMATPWENRPQKRIRPERAPSPARSIRKRGFLMGRPFRASCFRTDQTHGVAVGCEWPARGGKPPVIFESWYDTRGALRGGRATTFMSGPRDTDETPLLPGRHLFEGLAFLQKGRRPVNSNIRCHTEGHDEGFREGASGRCGGYCGLRLAPTTAWAAAR